MIEDTGNGWRAITSWGYGADSVWATREMAEAVEGMPEPSVEELLREVQFWKEAHQELISDAREVVHEGRSLTGVIFWHTKGHTSSPLQVKALGLALKARIEYNKAHDTKRTE